MSQSFEFGQRVTATLSDGRDFSGDFCGVVGAAAVVRIGVWNTDFPVGSLASFPVESLQVHCAPVVELRAPVVELRAPAVELTEEDFPTLPKAAPRVELSARRVESSPSTVVSAAPRVVTAPLKVERSAPDAAKLEEAAITLLVAQTVSAVVKTDLRAQVSHTTHDERTIDVRCPAFDYVEVRGKFVRASISHALSKRTSEIRDRVVQRLGFVPPGTYIRFSWDFKRDAAGKLLEEEGVVTILFRW